MVVRKVWRSELGKLFLFLLLAVVSSLLSQKFPASIIKGELIPLGDYRVSLSLPIFWLFPASALLLAVIKVYNVRYVITEQGIESKEGILALRQTITTIRYEDIRSIETDQSVVDRILDVGDVEVGTAAVGLVEVVLHGISEPKKIQALIQAKRDSLKGGSQQSEKNMQRIERGRPYLDLSEQKSS